MIDERDEVGGKRELEGEDLGCKDVGGEERNSNKKEPVDKQNNGNDRKMRSIDRDENRLD